jgi:hypothetical protein
MDASSIFVLIALVTLALIFVYGLYTGRVRQRSRITPLSALGMALIILAMFLGGNRAVGYTLIGVGVLLALTDLARTLTRR